MFVSKVQVCTILGCRSGLQIHFHLFSPGTECFSVCKVHEVLLSLTIFMVALWDLSQKKGQN